MTPPIIPTGQYDLGQQTRALNSELDSSIAGTEWNTFLARRKELLDQMIQAAQPQPDPADLVKPPGTALVPVQPGASAQQPTPDQIGQAHFWGIENPEKMDAAELQHQIDQRRADVPRDQQTSLSSALFAGAAGFAASAGAAAKGIGYIFQNVAGALDHVPFIGPSLASLLSNDQSKLFWQHLQSRSAEAVEAAQAMQPQSDLSAFQFLTGVGKMAGYALPAVAAWEGLGATAGMPRLSWLGKMGTPLMRAAAKGALTSALLQDPDEPENSKIMNLGLGAIMGGSQMWGALGAATALGAIGAGVGGQIGATPEERSKNALRLGLGGAALPFFAPFLTQAFAKVAGSFPSEWDAAIAADQSGVGVGGPGEVMADYEILNDKPQVSGNPVPESMRLAAGEPPTQEVNTPEDLSAVLRFEPTRQIDPNGGTMPVEAQPTAPTPATPGALPIPQGVAGLLRDPNAVGSGEQGTLASINEINRILAEHPAPDEYYDTPYYRDDPSSPTIRQVHQGTLARLTQKLESERYQAREETANLNRLQAQNETGLASVTKGPAHLLGSKVAADDGSPLRVFHGTNATYDEMDLEKADPTALYGIGLYHSESPDIASRYPDPSGAPTAWLPSFTDGSGQLRPEVSEQIVNEISQRPTDPIYNPTIQSLQQDVSLKRTPELLTPEVLDKIAPDLAEKYLDPASAPAPQVRPAYLDIKNPFNIDKTFSQPEISNLLDKLNTAFPEIDWPAMDHFQLRAKLFNQSAEGMTGDDIYKSLSQAQIREPQQGPNLIPGEFGDQYPNTIIGRSGLNQVLKSIGYDGITHIGGKITGSPPHRVWIAFDPLQVHPTLAPRSLDTGGAVQTAEAITKQATVMESATLANAVGKVELTDSDVVQAAKSNNPGGTAVVRGVGRPLDVMQDHPDVVFVEREGKLDALVGEFTPKMIDDYKRWGMYEGNLVVTQKGLEGEVMSINGKGMAMLKRPGGGPPIRAKVENLLPSRYGDPEYSGADLWPSFKADLLNYMNDEAQRAGMAPVESIWDARVPGMMETHLMNYLDRRGIGDPGTRHAIDLAINHSWVEEARALDPEAQRWQSRLGDEATQAENDNADNPIPTSIEETAENRGFVWLSNPGRDGGILRDTLNPEGAFEVPVESDEAAEEFLRSVDRTAPNMEPASDVPADVMESVPTGTSFEPRVGQDEFEDNYEDDLRTGDRLLDRLEAEHAAGGGEPPQPPAPPGPAAFGEPSGPEFLPRDETTLGDQFQKLYRQRPDKWAELERRWSGGHFRYTRYLMANLENDLVNAGIDKGRAWKQINALETARTKSDNEAYDWLKEHGEIMRMFPKELIRSGFVTRTHEITSDPEKFRRFWGLREKGYSDAAIKKMIEGDRRLGDFYHRLFMSGVNDPSINLQPEREIQNYMSHLRMWQAQGRPDPFDPQGLLSPEFQFFAEFARDGNVQARIMDASTLGNYYIRSMMFKKYQAAPYEDLVRTWQDQRIPANIRNLLLDHAKAMRFGYTPKPTLMMRAVQGVLGKLGVPITTSEAARIVGAPLGWMYRSMLGGRTSIFFRDATQPLMALAKVRAGFLTDVYGDILNYWRSGDGAEQLKADYQLALKHGWVSRERPAMESTSVFEDQPGVDTQLLSLTPEQLAKRESLARIGDVVLPPWLRNFDHFADTLRLYGKEQRLNQFIPGLAAFRQAKTALAEFRQSEVDAALQGNPNLAMNYDDFARRAFFSSFQPAIKNHLKELVDAGNDEEAAATFAREVVKWSQQVYTVREKPKALRQGFGRIVSFLGNFTGQFVEGAYASMRYGEPQHIARALMVLGGFSYVMAKMGEKLGMRNLANWAWSSALHYSGSPLLEQAAQAVTAYAGLGAMADDRTPTELQTTALEQLPGLLPEAASFFPYSGYIKSVNAVGAAAQGVNPVADITRLLVSGDRGSGIDYMLQSRARADTLYQRLTRGSLSPNGGLMPTAQQPTQPVPPIPPNRHPGAGSQQ